MNKLVSAVALLSLALVLTVPGLVSADDCPTDYEGNLTMPGGDFDFYVDLLEPSLEITYPNGGTTVTVALSGENDICTASLDGTLVVGGLTYPVHVGIGGFDFVEVTKQNGVPITVPLTAGNNTNTTFAQ